MNGFQAIVSGGSGNLPLTNLDDPPIMSAAIAVTLVTQVLFVFF